MINNYFNNNYDNRDDIIDDNGGTVVMTMTVITDDVLEMTTHGTKATTVINILENSPTCNYISRMNPVTSCIQLSIVIFLIASRFLYAIYSI